MKTTNIFLSSLILFVLLGCESKVKNTKEQQAEAKKEAFYSNRFESDPNNDVKMP